jgi:transcriptional regulator with XRE-family HTH domain
MLEIAAKSSISRHTGQALLAPPRKAVLYDGRMEIKQWVKAARDHAGLTIEQLAHKMGRSKAAAGFWETGTTKPSYAQMLKISEITGHAMPEQAAPAATSAIDIRTARAKLWPYPRIDYEKFVALSGAAARNIENAILATASDMDVDLRTARSAKRAAT